MSKFNYEVGELLERDDYTNEYAKVKEILNEENQVVIVLSILDTDGNEDHEFKIAQDSLMMVYSRVNKT